MKQTLAQRLAKAARLLLANDSLADDILHYITKERKLSLFWFHDLQEAFLNATAEDIEKALVHLNDRGFIDYKRRDLGISVTSDWCRKVHAIPCQFLKSIADVLEHRPFRKLHQQELDVWIDKCMESPVAAHARMIDLAQWYIHKLVPSHLAELDNYEDYNDRLLNVLKQSNMQKVFKELSEMYDALSSIPLTDKAARSLWGLIIDFRDVIYVAYVKDSGVASNATTIMTVILNDIHDVPRLYSLLLNELFALCEVT